MTKHPNGMGEQVIQVVQMKIDKCNNFDSVGAKLFTCQRLHRGQSMCYLFQKRTWTPRLLLRLKAEPRVCLLARTQDNTSTQVPPLRTLQGFVVRCGRLTCIQRIQQMAFQPGMVFLNNPSLVSESFSLRTSKGRGGKWRRATCSLNKWRVLQKAERTDFAACRPGFNSFCASGYGQMKCRIVRPSSSMQVPDNRTILMP